METKKISVYSPEGEGGLGKSYDTGVPIDLFDAFSKLKEELVIKSNGIYEATPIIFNPNELGVISGIIEVKDGRHTKTEYVLTITKR
jgi:hypothetical protein